MPLTRLEHYLILSHDVDATREFYVDVLGLAVGERPPFPFPGYWLYLDGVPCVHLAGAGANQAQNDYLGGERAVTEDTGALDHVAFSAIGLDQTLARLEALGVAVRQRTVPEQGSHQVFITDPNGITVELNFSSRELEEPQHMG